MQRYKRITYEDRCQIYAFKKTKISTNEVSRELRFHRSTIYRELRRNTVNNGAYYPLAAHKLGQNRRRSCRKPEKINDQKDGLIMTLLMEGWSPEQISGRLRQEKNAWIISHETIYRFLRRHRKELLWCLRRHGKRGAGRYLQRKSRHYGKLWIHQRPQVVAQRSRIGDWERDGMYGADRRQLLVCVERKSRYVKIANPETFNRKLLSRLTMQMIQASKRPVHTITNDRGPEFEDGKNMKVPVYYCDAQRPNQK